jgi:lysozyme family protein
MAPTPDETAAGYRNLWARARVLPGRQAPAQAIARKILERRARYETVEKKTGVPWFMIGVIHNREASMNFSSVLHNGEKIIGTGRRTKLVPAARGPFGSWEEAAIDALTMPPHSLHRVVNWTLERMLYEIEKYNGWGYLGKTNSPYLWSCTTEYRGGKYVADHVFGRIAVDAQAGCAAILKVLAEIDAGVAARLGGRQAVILPMQQAAPTAAPVPPPPDPEPPPTAEQPALQKPAQPARSGGFFVALIRALFGRR